MDTFIFVLEIIGTVAFASSGAMTAIEKKMDIFGVNILGATTAVGGGMMRDIILGVTPPAAFSQPVYILFSILTSTLLFAIVYTNPEILHSRIKNKYYDKIMLWCDTAGLGIFTVVGIQTASRILPQDNPFFFVFIGVLTGVGGGVLRDIMAGETPLYPGPGDLCQRRHRRRHYLCGMRQFHGRSHRNCPWTHRYHSDPFPGSLFSLEPSSDPIDFFIH